MLVAGLVLELILYRRCERFSAKQSPDYLGLRLLRRYAPRKDRNLGA